jgi:hypothetical protein
MSDLFSLTWEQSFLIFYGWRVVNNSMPKNAAIAAASEKNIARIT